MPKKNKVKLETLASLILGAAKDESDFEFYHFFAGYVKCLAKIQNIFGAPALMIGFDGVSCNTEMYMLDLSVNSIIRISRIISVSAALQAYSNTYFSGAEYVYVDAEYDE